MKTFLLLIFALMIAAMPLSVAAVPKAAEDEDGTVVRMDPQVSKPRTGREAAFAPANGKKAAGRASANKTKKNAAKKTRKTSKKRKK